MKFILGTACALILGGILIAGLKPFHSPNNYVWWIDRENAVLFGDYGTISGARPFPASGNGKSFTVEMWIEPGADDDSNTFLMFYAPENPVPFSLRQQNGFFVLKGGPQDIFLPRIFARDRPVFLTIVSGPDVAIYIDGKLAAARPDPPLPRNALSGELVVGNSALRNDSWAGKLRGIAFYSAAINADAARRHFETWTTKGRPDIEESENPFAVYLFNERAGKVVRNQIKDGIDLVIPERYTVLHKIALDRMWNEISAGWGYWEDVLVNIAGFIPFGFFFYAYFLRATPMSRPFLAVMIAGFLLSLAIELTQVYLPTRDSSMTDVMTNTLGTYLGAISCRALARTRLFSIAQ